MRGTSRSDEETHDHIGSTSTTPSGVATPNPNPADKRLPGIINSYFGQVGARFSTILCNHKSCPAMATQSAGATSMDSCGHCPGALPTAPNTPNPLPNTELRKSSTSSGSALSVMISRSFLVPYPTPPTSSPGSPPGSSRGRGNSAGDGFFSDFAVNNGMPRLEDSFNGPRPALARNQSGSDIMPLRTYRKGSSVTPLSNILSNSSVHAAHLSNPASHPSTTPGTPNRRQSPVSALSINLASFLELTRLTDGVVAFAPIKSTPPLTPRALSTDGTETPKKLSPSGLTSQSEDHSRISPKIDRLGAVTPGTSSTPNSAPVGPLKGKLLVKVIEARGLRPSQDPFVVCVFERNESIAKAPTQAEGTVDKDENRDGFSGPLPIKRSASDMGRSMAIPMKSRQSSTTSISDHKPFKNGRTLTDPRWDHEGML